MSKGKLDSQGEIIDEVRRARGELWQKYRGDMRKLHLDSRQIAKKLGMKYATPKKKKEKDAA